MDTHESLTRLNSKDKRGDKVTIDVLQVCKEFFVCLFMSFCAIHHAERYGEQKILKIYSCPNGVAIP